MKWGVMTLIVLTTLAMLLNPGCMTEPPADRWVSLFDGRTLNGWVQRGGQAKFYVADGMIIGQTVPNTPNSFLCTTRDYDNFALELEFMVDEGLNSGVQVRSQSLPGYLNGRVHGYQVESDPSNKPYTGEPKNFLVDGSPAPLTEPRSWTGGIFDEARRGWLYPLNRNEPARRAFRRGQWNRLHIEVIGDTIRTWINNTPAADLQDGMTASGFIALQVHSSDTPGLKVRFRNIRIREISPFLHTLTER